ncbi:lysylphosphatidylglycerol synthase transmembrane domain-containing protein [Polynucleobacter sp. AP-Kolm-20A-A1]|uniref:lysylphosphatidylglycerol synthase transmembrane domain-containing protein n=1 Tax=Polynucleobacter sp. AP-Kolm-20A-A1 TaxID=2081041 RepID=UPI001BFDC22C|nr:lysylphosphatidylglycerol synthase transmembrane domain-containing protein [Polynucleobacter sp. AP-Kolm-20A-A1]QWE21145.1 flippase-like domain-containing protein [Polynucleobacter sp. AP-Kolm-20A-A1]
MSSQPQSTPKNPSGWKSILKRAWPTIRILLSIALLWKATSGIDWHALLDSQIKMEPIWLIAAAIAICCAFICGGLRWGFLMRSVGFQGSLGSYIALYFAGGLINQGLPSTLGGDSYRAITATHITSNNSLSDTKELDQELHHSVDLEHATPKLRLSFSMTFVDRLLGLAGNNLLGGLGLVIGGATLAAWGQDLGYAVLGVMILSGLLIAFILAWGTSRQLLQKVLDRLQMNNAMPGINLAFSWPMNMVQALFAIGVHGFIILAFGFCLRAYGAEAPISSLMIGLPALSLLLMLPISISGWGLREATLSSVLALWGVNPSLTVLASISYGAITVLSVLPGAYFLLKRK